MFSSDSTRYSNMLNALRERVSTCESMPEVQIPNGEAQ